MKLKMPEILVGNWIKLPETINFINQIAPTDITVLIAGETGVGKGALAKMIVANSERNNKSFVDVNCGAITESLLETTLFGHVKGAFTDAKGSHVGLFEEANGGTIFLDEITETSLNFQTKLLKVIDNKCIRRVGDRKDTPINVRVITATNKDIKAEVAKGRFREDLYYRLNLAAIQIPPLRDRIDEIPLFIQYFLETSSHRLNKEIPNIAPETLKILQNLRWSGNIRELKHAIEYAVMISDATTILPHHLPDYIKSPEEEQDSIIDKGNNQTVLVDKKEINDHICELYQFQYTQMIDKCTERYLRHLLKSTKGNINEVSKISGMARKTIYQKMKQFEMDLNDFRNICNFATTFDRIEEILKKISDLKYSKQEGETIEEYKKRVENLHLPFVSQLEGVVVEWVMPDYSRLPEKQRPENSEEEILSLNFSGSPVKDIINSIMNYLSVKSIL